MNRKSRSRSPQPRRSEPSQRSRSRSPVWDCHSLWSEKDQEEMLHQIVTKAALNFLSSSQSSSQGSSHPQSDPPASLSNAHITSLKKRLSSTKMGAVVKRDETSYVFRMPDAKDSVMVVLDEIHHVKYVGRWENIDRWENNMHPKVAEYWGKCGFDMQLFWEEKLKKETDMDLTNPEVVSLFNDAWSDADRGCCMYFMRKAYCISKQLDPTTWTTWDDANFGDPQYVDPRLWTNWDIAAKMIKEQDEKWNQ